MGGAGYAERLMHVCGEGHAMRSGQAGLALTSDAPPPVRL